MPRTQDIINSQTVTTIPSITQKRFAYDGNNNVVYAGSAPRGVSVDERVWTLTYYTYDGSNNVLTETTAFDSWSNRVGATYA